MTINIWEWRNIRMVRFGGGAHDGDKVDVCILCTEAKARVFRPSDA